VDDTDHASQERYPNLVLSAYAITRDWGRAEQVVRAVLARALGRRTATPPERLLTETSRLARTRTFADRLLRRQLDPYLPDAVLAHESVVAQHLAGRTNGEIATATDTREEDVAAALATVRAATVPPEHARLLTQLRQQRARRKTLAGAAVAVLLVALIVPLLRESAPKPTARLALPPPTPPQRTSRLHWVDFADREHGYALRFDCAVTDTSTSSCIAEVLATDDGEHWTPRAVPRPERRGVQLTGFPRILGQRELVVDWQADPNSALVDRMHSTDSGRHWARVDVPASVTETTPAIPAGGSPMLTCARATTSGACETPALGVVLPGSGRTALLATQPPLTEIMFGPSRMLRGDRWWVVGREPGTGKWSLAISADAGRTWWTTPVDAGSVEHDVSWALGGLGHTLYAAMTGLNSTGQGLSALYRSDDGGRTWTKTWQHGGQPPMLGLFSTPIIESDGTVLLHSIDPPSDVSGPTMTTYLSDDRGATFTKTAPRQVGYVLWTRAGYLSTPVLEGEPYKLSTDGTTWEQVNID
jgi:hypothetical protein